MITEKGSPRMDCAFFTGKECRATVCTCNSKIECGFFKTMSDHVESCNKAYERIARLPENDQLWISEKYYGGVMPWKET